MNGEKLRLEEMIDELLKYENTLYNYKVNMNKMISNIHEFIGQLEDTLIKIRDNEGDQNGK